MPCSGPGINEAQFEEAYKEIMTLLAKKYQIQDSEPVALFGQADNRPEMREAYNKVFKEALRTLFVWQAAEDF